MASSVHCGPARFYLHPPSGTVTFNRLRIYSIFLIFGRWLSFPSQQDQSSMSLSSSACPMMLCLRDRLLSLHQLLGLSLFQLTWQGLAERLDHFLYQDVSCEFSPDTHLP